MKYKIGDRVFLIEDHPDNNDDLVCGCTGTILEDSGDEGTWVHVRWDNEITGGHTCDGRCEDGYGWNVDPKWVEPLKEAEIDDEDIAEFSELCSFIGISEV